MTRGFVVQNKDTDMAAPRLAGCSWSCQEKVPNFTVVLILIPSANCPNPFLKQLRAFQLIKVLRSRTASAHHSLLLQDS